MSDKFELPAEVRSTIRRGVKALRRANKVPGVVYGHNIAATHVQMDLKELSTILRKAGRNSLITLQLTPPKMVLAREIQRNPITRVPLHIDFYEVSMTEKIHAQVRVILEGVSLDVKAGTGVLLQELNLIEIECLPGDLFDTFKIDISKMKIDDVVYVKDLVVPAGVQVLEDENDEVLRIQRFVEAKAEEVVAETGEVEVIEKGKKEEEEEEAKAKAKK